MPTSSEIRRIGDNFGCMSLKGATPAHEGEVRPPTPGRSTPSSSPPASAGASTPTATS